MSLQLKKFVLIISAILFGVAIVFFSISGSKTIGLIGPKESDPLTVNNEWRNTLTVIPSAVPSRTLGAEFSKSGATTTTAYIANEFVSNYALAQVSKGATPLSDADIQGITKTLLEKASTVDKVKQYSEKDLVVVPASTSTIETYKKETVLALNTFAQKNKINELSFVAKALDKHDASELAPLAENISNYQKLAADLLAIHVPQTMLAFHIPLLQGYTNMLAGVMDMKETISDPVRGVRGIAKYNNGASLVSSAVAIISKRK